MVQDVNELAVNTIRVLAGDMTRGANSGHPGKIGYNVQMHPMLTFLFHRRTYGMCSYGTCTFYSVLECESQES